MITFIKADPAWFFVSYNSAKGILQFAPIVAWEIRAEDEDSNRRVTPIMVSGHPGYKEPHIVQSPDKQFRLNRLWFSHQSEVVKYFQDREKRLTVVPGS